LLMSVARNLQEGTVLNFLRPVFDISQFLY
jgi:hypothetical protein